MGVLSEPDLERASGDGNGGSSADIEMRRFIRDEVRTAVYQEMNPTSTAPPSYDSSAPLLIADNPVPGPNGDTSTESHCVNTPTQNPRGWGHLLRVTAITFPVLAVIFSMPVLCITRVDELSISVLAFFLLLAFYCCAGLMVVIVASVQPKMTTETATQPTDPPTTTSDNTFLGGLIFCWHFWLTHMAFIGIVYWWLSGKPDALWAQFRSASAFNEKLGVLDGMGRLVDCLGNVKEIQKISGGVGRKASVADVVACLVDMGVNATGFIKGVDE